MRTLWGPLNKTLISAGEDGSLRLWDVEVRLLRTIAAFTRSPLPRYDIKSLLPLADADSALPFSSRDWQTGKQLAENRDHKKQISDLTMSPDLTHFITGSLDKTARARRAHQ